MPAMLRSSARFNPPPEWPPPPSADWRPPAGWQPEPHWPSAPKGHRFWVSPQTGRPTLGPAGAYGASTRTQRGLALGGGGVLLLGLLGACLGNNAGAEGQSTAGPSLPAPATVTVTRTAPPAAAPAPLGQLPPQQTPTAPKAAAPPSPSPRPRVAPAPKAPTAPVVPTPSNPVQPRLAPAPTPDAPTPPRYRTCAEAQAAGAAPLHLGDPGYSRKLDRDGDGVACELTSDHPADAPQPKSIPTPKPKPAPKPKPTPAPPAPTRPAPVVGSTTYANCTEARAAGVTPLHRGDPGYSRKLDRDGDGVACE